MWSGPSHFVGANSRHLIIKREREIKLQLSRIKVERKTNGKKWVEEKPTKEL
jgi:hypothetical protein